MVGFAKLPVAYVSVCFNRSLDPSPAVNPCQYMFWGPSQTVCLSFRSTHVGGCQNYGPFLGTLNALNIRCRIVAGAQKGTIILTTTHVQASPSLSSKGCFNTRSSQVFLQTMLGCMRLYSHSVIGISYRDQQGSYWVTCGCFYVPEKCKLANKSGPGGGLNCLSYG